MVPISLGKLSSDFSYNSTCVKVKFPQLFCRGLNSWSQPFTWIHTSEGLKFRPKLKMHTRTDLSMKEEQNIMDYPTLLNTNMFRNIQLIHVSRALAKEKHKHAKCLLAQSELSINSFTSAEERRGRIHEHFLHCGWYCFICRWQLKLSWMSSNCSKRNTRLDAWPAIMPELNCHLVTEDSTHSKIHAALCIIFDAENICDLKKQFV